MENTLIKSYAHETIEQVCFVLRKSLLRPFYRADKDLNNFIDRFYNSWKVATDIFADKHNLSVDTQKIQLCAQISQFYQI